MSLEDAYRQAAKNRTASKKNPLINLFDIEKEKKRCIEARDPVAYRRLSRSKKLSAALCSGQKFKAEDFDLPPLYPDHLLDQIYLDHARKVVLYFQEYPALFDRFEMTLTESYLQDLVRKSFGFTERRKLDSTHTKEMVLIALLMPLRQSVGSCFATAPAILIQSCQIERLLDDFFELLTKKELSRTFGGVKYIAPINPQLHIIDFETQSPLLKIWEYTLASFSDSKIEFYRWNLYASLGFNHKQSDGVGFIIYQHLEERIGENENELAKLVDEHNINVDRTKMAQALLSSASSRDRMRRYQTELTLHLHQLDQCKDDLDKLRKKGDLLASIFSFVLKEIEKEIPLYFQELYDADMHTKKGPIYEDAPAGYRLLFKHGRYDPDFWTWIMDGKSFVDCIDEFLRSIEPELRHRCEWEDGKQEISSIFGKLLYHIRTDAFLSSAHERIQAHLEKSGILPSPYNTPWSYSAGGNIQSLLKTYFFLEKELTEEIKQVENPLELATFLIDLLKEMPPSVLKSETSFLMHSPSHAFLLTPQTFRDSWDNNEFTYTWLRDKIIIPTKNFFQSQIISNEKQKFIDEQCKDMSTAEADAFQIFSHPLYTKKEAIKRYPKLKKPVSDFPSEVLTKGDLNMLANAIGLPWSCRDSFPILTFGDSNWPYYNLSFIYNPRTSNLEIWRTHQSGLFGKPMVEWKGSIRGKWGVFIRPFEYGGHYSTDIGLTGLRV